MDRRSSSGARNFAGAFLRLPAAEAEEALAALKALVPCVAAIPGRVGGRGDAARLERMMRKAAERVRGGAAADSTAGLERAIRLVTLLVRKNLRHLAASVVREGERIIDGMKGTLEVRLESAGPVDEDFLDALRERLSACRAPGTGAKRVRIVPVDEPALLGGYRLVIGGETIDASLRGQIRKMAADLRATLPAGGAQC
ncbi:MAG: F0F1 ATP synthase subunit delta [Treponema sp.]|jgi:F-type H+-transporting ATPase subunit delta|nr:F0F1 ATP synthase subunit delta [Treponema sp.]